MTITSNNNDEHGENPDAEPEVNPNLKFEVDEQKRRRKELDRAFREDGKISLIHFHQAKHLLTDYVLQEGKTFRTEDLRHIILVRDRLNTFIERVEMENGGEENVERLLQLFENEDENWQLNRPHWN